MTRAVPRRSLAIVLLALGGEILVASCADGVIDLFHDAGAGGLASPDAGGVTSASSGATNASASSSAAGTSTGGADACDPTCGCGRSPCGASCFDLDNDPEHCGQCDKGCIHNAYCRQGACTCLPGFEDCSGTCRFTAGDPQNCGGCGVTCAANQFCKDSKCDPVPCSGSLTACAGMSQNWWCVDLGASAPFCSSCGVVCGPNEVCAGATCQSYVPAPCASCPCTSCGALVGAPASCCSGIAGGPPICVHSATCPSP